MNRSTENRPGKDPADWVGKEVTQHSLLTGWQSDALAATLDRDEAPLRQGEPIPPGWHWLYFPEIVRLADTGVDGHPATGGFMPPVPLPRRMWAGNRMQFLQPLRVGEQIQRRSVIESVKHREGASGPLFFVTVHHEISGPGGLATIEDHDLVYRGPAGRAALPPRPPARQARWTRVVEPSPVMMFRFSALTFNSHRIHYDYRFATAQEGYPGLLFHGPLTMILLMDLLRRELPRADLQAFSVRATAPIYDNGNFTIHADPDAGGNQATLWATTADGGMAMSAEARYQIP